MADLGSSCRELFVPHLITAARVSNDRCVISCFFYTYYSSGCDFFSQYSRYWYDIRVKSSGQGKEEGQVEGEGEGQIKSGGTK